MMMKLFIDQNIILEKIIDSIIRINFKGKYICLINSAKIHMCFKKKVLKFLTLLNMALFINLVIPNSVL